LLLSPLCTSCQLQDVLLVQHWSDLETRDIYYDKHPHTCETGYAKSAGDELKEKLHDNMTMLKEARKRDNDKPRNYKRAMTQLSAAGLVEAGTYD